MLKLRPSFGVNHDMGGSEMRRIAHLTLFPLALVFVGVTVSAADLRPALRSENVCVGEDRPGDAEDCGAEPSDFGTVTMTFGCFDGGLPGGYKPNYVCQRICGHPYGPHCGHYTKDSWVHHGHACGYRWAQVHCY